MIRLGILHPKGLLAKELLERLRPHLDVLTIELLSSRQEDLGTLVEVDGEARLLAEATPQALGDLDLLVALESDSETLAPLLQHLPEGATAILVAPVNATPGATPLVSGVNLDPASAAGRRLVSPDATSITLAMVLDGLKGREPREAAVTVLESASVRGEEGLEELLGQARALLSFQQQPEAQVFGSQLAFNLLTHTEPPREDASASASAVSAVLTSVLGTPISIELQSAFAGTFHGLALSARVVFGKAITAEEARRHLEASPHLSVATASHSSGPVDVAGKEQVLVASVRQGINDHVLWFWLLCDNLTRGGASNLLDILTLVLQRLRTETVIH